MEPEGSDPGPGPRPAARGGRFKAHSVPRQMFGVKARDAFHVEDPHGLCTEYSASPVQWSSKAKR